MVEGHFDVIQSGKKVVHRRFICFLVRKNLSTVCAHKGTFWNKMQRPNAPAFALSSKYLQLTFHAILHDAVVTLGWALATLVTLKNAKHVLRHQTLELVANTLIKVGNDRFVQINDCNLSGKAQLMPNWEWKTHQTTVLSLCKRATETIFKITCAVIGTLTAHYEFS